MAFTFQDLVANVTEKIKDYENVIEKLKKLLDTIKETEESLVDDAPSVKKRRKPVKVGKKQKKKAKPANGRKKKPKGRKPKPRVPAKRTTIPEKNSSPFGGGEAVKQLQDKHGISQRGAVLAILDKHRSDGITAEDLRKAVMKKYSVDFTSKQISQALYLLREAGQIERDGDRRWSLING